jgi:DEAD/DEAH box helicase domain-containing protein
MFRCLNMTRYHPNPKFLPHPSRHVSLRGAEEDKYCAIDITNLIRGEHAIILEEIEISRAVFELYEGAVVNDSYFPYFLDEC